METYHAKNLKNLANYYIRQCFTLSSKEESDLTDEQVKLLNDVNHAIDLFNKKREILFEEKRLKRIQKAQDNLKEFIEKNPKDSTKDYSKKIESFEKAIVKAIECIYKPHSYVDKDNGLISYDFLNYFFAEYYKPTDEKYSNPYKDMAIQTSQQVLRNLFKDWKSYFNSVREYNKNKSKFTGRPKLPKYKQKDGRIKTSFTNQSCKVKDGVVILPKTKLTLKIGIDTSNLKLKEVRIIPNGSSYTIELVWDKTITIAKVLNKKYYIGIDLGLNNLATITNNIGLKPIIINGRPLKSINQYYNKKKANLQRNMPFMTVARYNKEKGILENKKIQRTWSKAMERLTKKRNAKIDDYMHKASKYIIEYCVEHSIGNIVIGKNKQWKSELNLGAANNQKFIQIPHTRFIQMVQYKAEAYGINVIIVEESYTSKASFLDFDILPTINNDEAKDAIFSGKRINRGLYKTNGIVINADVNGSFNIIRKANSKAFDDLHISKIKHIPSIIKLKGHKPKQMQKKSV